MSNHQAAMIGCCLLVMVSGIALLAAIYSIHPDLLGIEFRRKQREFKEQSDAYAEFI